MAKEAWYIRCLKSNESKQPGILIKACSAHSVVLVRLWCHLTFTLFPHSRFTGQFDEALIRHQVKYLGLMEHLRVRRAGFAYRRKFDVFLKRYNVLRLYAWFSNVKTCWMERLHLQHAEWGCLLRLTDINRCARPPGLTGEECLLMEWKCWFNIWATCQLNTKWGGEDNTAWV